MQKIKILLLVTAVGLLLSACMLTKFDGSRTGNENQLIMEFKVLNTTDFQMLTLINGDVLDIEVVKDSGEIGIFLQKEEEKPLFIDTDISTGSFQVEIDEDGTYQVFVTGIRARGSVSVVRREDNADQDTADIASVKAGSAISSVVSEDAASSAPTAAPDQPLSPSLAPTTTPDPSPSPTPTPRPVLDAVAASKILFALYLNGGWGIINGMGEIIVEPEHCFSHILPNGLYFISDDAVNLTTGKIFNPDGTRLMPDIGDLTLIGGGPDCDSAHIRTDVYLYEKNGLKGLVRPDGIKLTAAKYEQVSSDYSKRFLYTRKDGRYGIAMPYGEVTPPVYDEYPTVLGVGDPKAEILFSHGMIAGEEVYYKGDKPIGLFEEIGWVDQIEGALFIDSKEALTLLDENFKPIYRFPEGVNFSSNCYGPEGPYSVAGLIPVEKDGQQGLADHSGKMLVPFRDDDFYYDDKVGMIYTSKRDPKTEELYKEYIDIGLNLPITDDEVSAKMPETVFSLGLSPYYWDRGVWSGCVRDDTEPDHDGIHRQLEELLDTNIRYTDSD